MRTVPLMNYICVKIKTLSVILKEVDQHIRCFQSNMILRPTITLCSLLKVIVNWMYYSKRLDPGIRLPDIESNSVSGHFSWLDTEFGRIVNLAGH